MGRRWPARPYLPGQETEAKVELNHSTEITAHWSRVVPFYWHSNFSKAERRREFQGATQDVRRAGLRAFQKPGAHEGKQGGCATSGGGGLQRGHHAAEPGEDKRLVGGITAPARKSPCENVCGVGL